MITFGGPGDCLQPPGFPGIYFHNPGMSHDIPAICQDLLLGSRFLYRKKIHQTGGFPVPGVVHLVIQLIQTANLQQSRVQFARTAHRLHLTALYTVHTSRVRVLPEIEVIIKVGRRIIFRQPQLIILQFPINTDFPSKAKPYWRIRCLEIPFAVKVAA